MWSIGIHSDFLLFLLLNYNLLKLMTFISSFIEGSWHYICLFKNDSRKIRNWPFSLR